MNLTISTLYVLWIFSIFTKSHLPGFGVTEYIYMYRLGQVGLYSLKWIVQVIPFLIMLIPLFMFVFLVFCYIFKYPLWTLLYIWTSLILAEHAVLNSSTFLIQKHLLRRISKCLILARSAYILEGSQVKPKSIEIHFATVRKIKHGKPWELNGSFNEWFSWWVPIVWIWKKVSRWVIAHIGFQFSVCLATFLHARSHLSKCFSTRLVGCVHVISLMLNDCICVSVWQYRCSALYKTANMSVSHCSSAVMAIAIILIQFVIGS